MRNDKAIERRGWKVRGATLWAALLAGTGCWRVDPVGLDIDRIPFSPESGGAPAAWSVVKIASPLACPDDEPASVWVLRPDAPPGPLPAVVMFHSGAFDYELEPVVDRPLTSATWQDPTRLGAPWASRRVLFTLGLLDDDDPYEASDGALAAAIATHGAAIVLPANCWADYWHSASALSPNDPIEGYTREGRALADWSWRLAGEPGFAAAEGVTLGFEPAAGPPALIGVAEGGRAVGELLGGGRSASVVLLDGSLDDVRPYTTDPTTWAEEVTGLGRLWPVTDPVPGMVATAPGLPGNRTGLVYSGVDPSVPAGMQTAAAARVTALGGWLLDTGASGRAQLGANPTLAVQAADWMFPAAP